MVIPSESYASYVVPIKWHLVQLRPSGFLPQAHSAAIDCLATFAKKISLIAIKLHLGISG
jgi:hypothetical protein